MQLHADSGSHRKYICSCSLVVFICNKKDMELLSFASILFAEANKEILKLPFHSF